MILFESELAKWRQDIKTHSEDYVRKTYIQVCELCSTVFESRQGYRHHMAKHQNKTQVICDTCGHVASDIFNLRTHIPRHHSSKESFECRMCSRVFATEAGQSRRQGHVKKPLAVSSAINLFRQPSTYTDTKASMPNKNSPARYATSVPEQEGLKVHIDNVHLNKYRFSCDKCPKSYNSRSKLAKHVKFDHEGERHQCPLCNKVFKDERHFNIHTKSHNPGYSKPQFTCEVCHKVLGVKSYDRHMKMHSGENYTNIVCDLCGKSMSTKSHLTNHRRTHTGEKPYECNFCGKTFARNETLIAHRRVHTKERPYVCEVCTKAFTQKSALTIHMRYHTGERPYPCAICDKRFITKTLLKAHNCEGPPDTYSAESQTLVLRIKEEKEDEEASDLKFKYYNCPDCTKTFSSPSNLRKHKIVHSDRKFACDLCDKVFLQKYNLEYHKNFKHFRKFICKCDYCDQVCLNKNGLKLHIDNVHLKKYKFCCDRCSKGYNTQSELTKHIKFDHEGLRYSCLLCGKEFKDNNHFKLHIKTHDPNYTPPQFTCEVCQKVLSMKSFDRHMKMHSGEKDANVVCDICGLVMSSRSHLTNHRRTHTGEKPYECEYCGKTFARNETLVDHRRVHTKERPYKCAVCNKGFTQKSALNVHKRIHTGERPHFCFLCTRKFNTKHLLKQHKCSGRPDEVL
nr:unnamed protein product [Callosobruchus analis]